MDPQICDQTGKKSLKGCYNSSKKTDYFLVTFKAFRLENYYEGSPFGNNYTTIIGRRKGILIYRRAFFALVYIQYESPQSQKALQNSLHIRNAKKV